LKDGLTWRLALISFGIDPVRSGYSPSEASQLIRRIHDEIRTSQSVETSAVARFQLLTGGSWNNAMYHDLNACAGRFSSRRKHAG
jgi:hypothetical protein